MWRLQATRVLCTTCTESLPWPPASTLVLSQPFPVSETLCVWSRQFSAQTFQRAFTQSPVVGPVPDVVLTLCPSPALSLCCTGLLRAPALPPWLLTLICSLPSPFPPSGPYSQVPFSVRLSWPPYLNKIAVLSHALISSQLYFQLQHLPTQIFLMHSIYFATFYFGKCKPLEGRDLCFIQCGPQVPRTTLGTKKAINTYLWNEYIFILQIRKLGLRNHYVTF